MERLHCPITMRLFKNPVQAEDGFTYEEDAILDWLRRNGTSPDTGAPLDINRLQPNRSAKRAIRRFREECSARLYHYQLDEDIDRQSGTDRRRGLHTIFDASWRFNGPPIVLAELEGLRNTEEASFLRDITSHAYIAKIYGVIEQRRSVLLVLEASTMSDLASVLAQIHSISNETLKIIFRQITEAMNSCPVIHGNLSCQSVLVYRLDNQTPENTLVKLTDFGLCEDECHRWFERIDGTAMSNRLSLRYTAPELFPGQPRRVYTEKCDVYSMGTLMWQAWSKGRLPWANLDLDEQEIREHVLSGAQLRKPKSCPEDDWRTIVKPCLSMQPRHRPTFEQLHDHLLTKEHIRIQPLHRQSPVREEPRIFPDSVAVSEKIVLDEASGPQNQPQSCGCICKHKLRTGLIVFGIIAVAGVFAVGLIVGLRAKSSPIEEVLPTSMTTATIFSGSTSSSGSTVISQASITSIGTGTTAKTNAPTVTTTTTTTTATTMPIFSPCPPTIANPIETKDILLLDETVNSKNYTRYAIRYTSPSGGTRTATLMFEFQIAWGSWYVDSVSIRQTFGGVQLIDNGGFESGTLGSHWKFCHAYYPWITASVSEQFCYVDRYCLSTTESFVPSLEYLTQAFNIRSNTQYDIEFFLLPVGDPLSAKVTMIAY